MVDEVVRLGVLLFRANRLSNPANRARGRNAGTKCWNRTGAEKPYVPAFGVIAPADEQWVPGGRTPGPRFHGEEKSTQARQPANALRTAAQVRVILYLLPG